MPTYYDTLLGEYIKNPGRRGLSLDDIASSQLEYKTIHYDEITGKWKINFKDVDLDVAAKYSGEDVYVTSRIYQKQKTEKHDTNKVFMGIEMPLIHVLKYLPDLSWLT